jgi:hypothetical protein
MSLLSQSPRHARRRKAFTLAEVIVTMALLWVVLLSIARMAMVVAQRGRTNAISATRTLAMIEEANYFGALSYARLSTFSLSNATVTSGDLTYIRRLGRTIAGNRIAFKIAIVPAADTTMADSVWVYRSLPAQSPLCVGC